MSYLVEKHHGINATTLKWIAIIAMIADHIALLATSSLPSELLFVMRITGRFTMPIICYLIAEGFYHTRNRGKYARRLLVFAVISQLPFNYFLTGTPFRIVPFNVLFCLLLGFCALWMLTSERSATAKAVIVALCIIGSVICDWLVIGVLWILAFGLNRGNFKKQAIWFSLIVIAFGTIAPLITGDLSQLMQFGTVLSLPLLMIYNGKKEGDSTPAWMSNKWMFYVFYPLHLLLLAFMYFELGLF